jgi:hypothetical protein
MPLPADGQGLAVRRETHGPHLVGAIQCFDQLPGLCAPESYSLISSAARERATISRECDRDDRQRVPLEHLTALAGGVVDERHLAINERRILFSAGAQSR